MSDIAVRFDAVSIVFGDDPGSALPLMDEGCDRPEISDRTGQVLGVHDCTIDVPRGEILVLMGLSGSGKSTLIRAVNGLNRVTRGHVTIDTGEGTVDVTAADAATLRRLRRRHVSMVFQQFALLPWRSVAQNVGLGLEFSGTGRHDRDRRVAEQLELVGLADRAQARVAELSGGMQQRVGLARAFATEAPILLMDEPFSALDPLIRTRLQDDLIDLQHRLGRTVIFVSHDLDEAFRLGDRIAIMEGGRIVQHGRPRDIWQDPATEYVADFVAHMDPLAVLTARDVAVSGPRDGGPEIAPDASLADVMARLSDGSGHLAISGMPGHRITPDSVVARLARPRG